MSVDALAEKPGFFKGGFSVNANTLIVILVVRYLALFTEIETRTMNRFSFAREYSVES